jgi:hypothetical protein
VTDERDFVEKAEPALALQQTNAALDLFFKHLKGKQWHDRNGFLHVAARVAYNR